MMMVRLFRGNRIHLFELNHLLRRLELGVLVMKVNIGDYLRFLIRPLLHSHLLNLIDITRVILPGELLRHPPKPLKYHKDHTILDIHPSPPKASIHKQTSLHHHHRDYRDTPYPLLLINLVLLLKNLGDYHNHNLRYNPIRISECLALKKGLVLL
jgi:hypothetical protein